MEMIEKTGKTVEDALEAALAELGVDRDQVEYKVLEVPLRKSLPMIDRPIGVRVQTT